MALSKEEILEAISEMSVMDIVDLISAMEEKFGVSAAAPVAVAATAPSSGEAEGSDEAEAASGDLLLAEVGDKKVDVINAKGLVDGAPSVIKEGIPKTEADEYFKQLEEAGAKAEFK